MAQGLKTEMEENILLMHDQKIGNKLEQHLLNLRARRSFAITEEKNQELADSIDIWFIEFEKNIKHLFEDPSTKLGFDPNRSKFYIQQDNNHNLLFKRCLPVTELFLMYMPICSCELSISA